ncbi:MAG: hypothetical protein IPM97_14715 [Bdellovibrionaceae bacterium]|nr:hypothetical protein [Pseudobdellovibrionaceae bacterium]
MLEKGTFSFVALLVINPVVILLFQNYTLLPETQSQQLAARDMAPQKRSISSVLNQTSSSGYKLKISKPNISSCNSSQQDCPAPNIE